MVLSPKPPSNQNTRLRSFHHQYFCTQVHCLGRSLSELCLTPGTHHRTCPLSAAPLFHKIAILANILRPTRTAIHIRCAATALECYSPPQTINSNSCINSHYFNSDLFLTGRKDHLCLHPPRQNCMAFSPGTCPKTPLSRVFIRAITDALPNLSVKSAVSLCIMTRSRCANEARSPSPRR